jgi:hypothetical protein
MPHATSPDDANVPERRRAGRNRTHHPVSVRVNPDRDGPAFSGKLQDVSAGGIGMVTDRVVPLGATFLVKPFRDAGTAPISLLYRAVRCVPKGRRFLVGGVLISVAGNIERDANGRIVAADLERVRRILTAA